MQPTESWTRVEPRNGPPRLIVVVDTEEEFDWSRPHDRNSTGVTAIAAQTRAHRVFEKFGIRPTYVVDYPVASLPDGYLPLKELYDDGLCDIGAHLHPWVNPPHEETVNARNSYPGNLPAALERAKLERLTGAISDNFGIRPTIYKAGRYGLGPSSFKTLRDLGYTIDASVLANSDLRADGGPDYRRYDSFPAWVGEGRRLLEVPVTVGFAGALAGAGRQLYHPVAGEAGQALHLPGVLARLGLLERIPLSPESADHDAHRRLTQALLVQGLTVFSFCYHSPTLDPGHTPYVRDQAELDRFLERLDRYFEYFMGELGGVATTLAEFHDSLLNISEPVA